MSTLRFPVIPREAMSPAQIAVADAIAGGARGSVRGPFLPLMHNPALSMTIQALGEHLRFNTGLPQSLVELIILVTARRWSCQYEWLAHSRLARNEGLPEPIIAAIALNKRPDSMTDDQAVVYDFGMEVFANGAPTDETCDKAEALFGKAAVLDLLALCGYYSMLAMVLNTAAMPLPDGAPPPLPTL